MKIQGVSGNLFSNMDSAKFSEAGIFREDMTEKPGKCEADNKKKARIAAVKFGLFDIGCPSALGDFYYIIENFSVVCRNIWFHGFKVMCICVQD